MHNLNTNVDLQTLTRIGYRLTPATMAVKITQGRWIPAKHLVYISTIVATAIMRGRARIIVTVPPRHGKSEFLSVNTPLWFLDWFPDKYVMGLSYGLDLATDFSLKVRTALMDPMLQPLFNVRLRSDKLKIDRFLTVQGGGYTAAGIGGVITGRDADLLLIDDYTKNAEAALSKAQRDKDWEWFKSTAYTRKNPGASVIVLATRWDCDDMIAHLTNEMPGKWLVINLPALAYENDPLGRAVGEPLWPERYDMEALMDIKSALGTYWWNALYQQRPLASMGGLELGNYLKYIDAHELPPLARRKTVRSWDMAATEGAGDFTAGLKMHLGLDNGKIFIEDLQHDQLSPQRSDKLLETTANTDGYGVPIWFEQEPGSAGKIVISNYTTQILPGFSVKGERATGPLEVRAQPFLAAVESGNVYCVRAPWNAKFREELNGFPTAEHDDIIAAGALAYSKLVLGRRGSVVWGREAQQATNTGVIRTYSQI